MKKKFKLENLGCANCAAKMESDINKLDGVEGCTVNFMASKMIIEAADEKFDEILSKAHDIVHKYESDCNIIVK
ncbi:MAG: cation transporter [Peptostreptococcaceae bacterium]|nr:cation transporter [Peptostreptococcaceae bacterium]MDY5739160.1 cation transporter [Anaerovoracaceae bacterium]SFE31707.1 Heavy-metal-associated domain-containing protein [Peptostreptococcaceae bacterium pGA-8]